MRLLSHRGDDADVIRARLRALLAEGSGGRGWVPEADDGTSPPAGEADDETTLALADTTAEPDHRPPPGIGRHRSPGPTVRWDPGRHGVRALWTVGLAAALLLLGWTWLHRPRVEPVPELSGGVAVRSSVAAAPTRSVGVVDRTSSTVVVSVVGQVAQPGLVTLPPGARIADAVAAAGGLLPAADPALINLAAVVSDGQQIAVGVPAAPAAPGSGTGAAGAAGPVNLNTATAAELDALPGVGPVLAQRIVGYRDAHGPFRSVDQLDDVPGIGPAIAARLAGLVIV